MVVGQYLYINGGEINYAENTQIYCTWRHTCHESSDYTTLTCSANKTYIIDLSKSWKNSTVEIRAISKAIDNGPILNGQTLWEASGNAFYAFGGQPSRARNGTSTDALKIPNALWKFQINDPAGSGSWQIVPTSPDSNFMSLVRPAGDSSSFGGGQGYYLGGFQGDVEVFCVECDQPLLPGLLTYDQNANKWLNQSVSILPHGVAMRGSMQFIPNFGKAGILLFPRWRFAVSIPQYYSESAPFERRLSL